MSIIERFKTIMASNIQARVNQSDEPEKMAEQVLRELQRDYAVVKSEMTTFVAKEQRAKRMLDECIRDISKMKRYAEKSLEYGNEREARSFLEKKMDLIKKENELKEKYITAQSNSKQLQQVHDKLATDVRELEHRFYSLKAQATSLQSKKRINEMGRGITTSTSKLEELEDEVNRAIFEAEALDEIRNGPQLDGLKHADENEEAFTESKQMLDVELAKLKDTIENEQKK